MPSRTVSKLNALLALLLTMSSWGCSAAAKPQILGTDEELAVYPPFCVPDAEVEALVTNHEGVARQISAHNLTVERRHGASAVDEGCS